MSRRVTKMSLDSNRTRKEDTAPRPVSKKITRLSSKSTSKMTRNVEALINSMEHSLRKAAKSYHRPLVPLKFQKKPAF